jgi:hypothetical protein
VRSVVAATADFEESIEERGAVACMSSCESAWDEAGGNVYFSKSINMGRLWLCER